MNKFKHGTIALGTNLFKNWAQTNETSSFSLVDKFRSRGYLCSLSAMEREYNTNRNLFRISHEDRERGKAPSAIGLCSLLFIVVQHLIMNTYTK